MSYKLTPGRAAIATPKPPKPADGGFEARMNQMQKMAKLKPKPKQAADLKTAVGQAYDADAAEQARRAANLRAAKEQERQGRMQDEARKAREAANLRKARGG